MNKQHITKKLLFNENKNKDMKKKILLSWIIIFLRITISFAQGGTTGPLIWNIENGILTISGKGKMPDYTASDGIFSPWYNNKLITSIVIEDGVESIGSQAFLHCSSVFSVNIPISVTKIGGGAFSYCESISSIFIPSNIISIGSTAFSVCISLTSIRIPEEVTSIGSGTFYWCINLKSIYIPKSVTYIGGTAFYQCTSLSSITIPQNVTYIGLQAFERCASLISITNLNPVPVDIYRSVFREVNINACTLYVPVQSVEAYKAAEVWKEFIVIGKDLDIDDLNPTAQGMVVYPNPTNGPCTVTIPEDLRYESNLTLSVYHISGKLIKQIPVVNGSDSFSFQFENQTAGVYFVVLGNGKKNYSGKVVFN